MPQNCISIFNKLVVDRGTTLTPWYGERPNQWDKGINSTIHNLSSLTGQPLYSVPPSVLDMNAITPPKYTIFCNPR